MLKGKLVVSTNNKNKLKEIKEILKDLPIEVLSKDDVGLSHIDIVEDGNSLSENSIKKAKGLADKLDYMIMADDSGLFVDALNGEPGVYSSRYAGEEGNDKKNNIKLLKEMAEIPKEERIARFISVIAIINEEKETIIIKGECEGTIAYVETGNHGFGYDPLFIPKGYNKTFAELDESIKNKISHRAKALESMKKVLEKIVKDDTNENISN